MSELDITKTEWNTIYFILSYMINTDPVPLLYIRRNCRINYLTKKVVDKHLTNILTELNKKYKFDK